MAVTERITMTMRELDRFKVIQDVADGKLKPWRAAERLDVSRRQVEVLGAWRKTFEGYHLYCANRRHATSAFSLLVDTLRYRKP